jgi:octaprenyl-diphosphate synthase
VALVRQVAEYIVGRRAASACGRRWCCCRRGPAATPARRPGGESHYELAAVVEFIHTATLLHDDVVDASELRRGRHTANAEFGNAASVLVGDFLYSRAFQMMLSVNSKRVMQVLADATNTIAEGEVLQLMNCHDPAVDEERYLDVIRRKTAKLFEAAARLGAVLAGAPAAVETGLAEYGTRLGTAFQLIDDVLDYSGDAGRHWQEPGRRPGRRQADAAADPRDGERAGRAVGAGAARHRRRGARGVRARAGGGQGVRALDYAREAPCGRPRAARAALAPLPASKQKDLC